MIPGSKGILPPTIPDFSWKGDDTMNVTGMINSYQSQTDVSNKTENVNSIKTDVVKNNNLGKTVGEPKLSKEAEEYYNQLKTKYGQYDFVLVSSDEKENARANAGKYANNIKTVVLIDEEKIEKMATDSNYRKQYEGILSGATQQINKIKATAAKNGANLKGVVMQVNDDGTASYFAALKKTSDAQKTRIEKQSEEKKADKKAEQKKKEKKLKEKQEIEKLKEKRELEKLKDKKAEKSETENREEVVTLSSDSLDGLLKKIEEYGFNERSNSVLTDSEKQIGQNIDFRG